jgi:hypothetical protein
MSEVAAPNIEPELNAPKSQFETNLHFLEQIGAVGDILAPLYKEAVRLEPSLGEVRLVVKEMEGENPAFAAARSAWNSKSGRHEVGIGYGDQAMDKIGEHVEDFGHSIELMAEVLGVKPEEFNADMLLRFAFLHELGHAVLFSKYQNDPDAYKQIVKEEKSKLPIRYRTSNFLLSPEHKKFAEDNWQQISRSLGVSSFEELSDLQESRYRQMKQEKFADLFAAGILNGRRSTTSDLGRLAGLE